MASQPSPLPTPSSLVPTITPASLSSLAIYNPSLGSTDETLPLQLVFYTSRLGTAAISENEKLRQIGLAQGIAEFARGFSMTEPNNNTSVETTKARIVTLELEPGWWIHAHVDLAFIHNPTVQPPTQEYSPREVAPPQLLLAQLRKAYNQFRFHYGTFTMNWERLDRSAFCKRLEKFWLRWAWVRWEINLHGSPVVDMLAERAIKMAGGGKLGSEIATQDREFMEGWVKKERGHGLVDMVVSRFGEEEASETSPDASQTPARNGSGLWFWPSQKSGGAAKDSRKKTEAPQPPVMMASDGCVFKGIGALEARDVAHYLSELYEKGEDTYVVTSNGVRRKRRRKRPNTTLAISSGESSPRRSTSTVRHVRDGPDAPTQAGSNLGRRDSESPIQEPEPEPELTPNSTITGSPEAPPQPSGSPANLAEDLAAKYRNLSLNNGKILNLLTFGWSSRVQLSRSTAAASEAGDSTAAEDNAESIHSEPPPPVPVVDEEPKKKPRGSFLIGFQGDLDIEDIDDDHEDSSGRITSRTVWLTRTPPLTEDDATEIPTPPLEEFRIVVYTNKPFLFAFLFVPHTRRLSSPSFYRSLHHQLSPLVPSLLLPSSPPLRKPPYDLLLTSNSSVYTTLPPIPPPGHDLPGWSRTDALHVYTIILGMLQERGDRERSARSMKGWWINWVKLDGGRGEGMIVRRAGGEMVKGGGGGGGEVDGAALVDVKKYFEGVVGTGDN